MNLEQLLTQALPEPLLERVQPLLWPSVRTRSCAGAEAGGHVLYWMRTAIRAHDNPALLAAAHLAEALTVPLFVYQGLSERYPFASDRHHRFILEGARDAHRELAELGICSAIHVERRGHRGPVLRELSERARVVITEDFPVAPLRAWTERLARSVETPVLCVDTACTVPMRLAARSCRSRRYERAYTYREDTAEMRHERLSNPWPRPVRSATAVPDGLAFEPVDLERADLAELISECDIDHSLGPVAHSVGGSVAGYRRWAEFRDQALDGYAARRNDALEPGTSRMSPYLHYGMVSPFRIAREAGEVGGAGARKFLDELTVWRELAWTFCWQEQDHGEVAGLPQWALQTLRDHEEDERQPLPWEALARAQSPDALWNAAQLSLLRHGELHNNLRMTWGKAVPHWCASLEQALATLIDLNHRYALDGRDPSSYGGLLWCLGQFDRAFAGESRVLGRVRSRSTRAHAGRLDLAAFEGVVRAAPFGRRRAVVVGGGMSGSACARALQDAGMEVVVLDKGRGAGGRMSSRRAPLPPPDTDTEILFDHGAQYFTCRDARMRPVLESWLDQGVIEAWRARIVALSRGRVEELEGSTERYTGVPGMSSVIKHLHRDLDVRFGTLVDGLEQTPAGWRVSTAHESLEADVVALALPPSQGLPFIPDRSHMKQAVAAVVMQPCWAVMAYWKKPLGLGWDGAFVSKSPLSWVARNGSKPGRADHESWTLHADGGWSSEHLESSGELVAAELYSAFAEAVAQELPKPDLLVAHRWRFAKAAEGVSSTSGGVDALYDPEFKLGVCGDWCPGSRVEGAWLSGCALAGQILHREAERARAVGELNSPFHAARQARLL